MFEIAMLVLMQITYFTAQDNTCMSHSPDLYFWMMAMILFQYCGLAVLICYFFRKLDLDSTDDFTNAEHLGDEENNGAKVGETVKS